MTQVAILLEQHWNRVPGGTAHSIVNLIDALGDDPRVSVVGVHGRHRGDPVLSLPPVPIERVPYPGRVLTESWSRTGRPRIDRWLGDVDILHAPAYVMPDTDLPCIATVHDLAFVRHPEWFTANGVGYLTRFVDRLRASECHVTVPSNTTANDCVAIGIDESRIHVVPWAVNANPIDSVAIDSARERYELPERFVLFVGTVEPRKNLDGLAGAMKLLPDVALVLVGPDGWGNVGDIDALRLSQLPRADLDAVIAAATVLAYPSHFEGFGLPVLEAMVQGTPVVTTRNTAAADVMGGGGLAVDTGSTVKLARAIDSVLDDRQLRNTLSVAAKKRAAEFTWKHTASAAVEAYEELVP